MNYHLQHGLTEDHRAAAAGLYWQAFGDKLGPVLGPEPRAMAFLTRVMRLDRCIAALHNDHLIGIAGYRRDGISFAGGTAQDLRHVYGWFGAAWRLPLLILIAQDDDRFLLDGIAVSSDQRGQGIGAALIAAIADLGRQEGHATMILDVADRNLRAQDLYSRHGFRTEKTTSIGPLRLIFGFDRVMTMVKDLHDL